VIDWQAVGEAAADLLGRYLQIDTTNPPGNERAAAEFLAQALRERGFEPRLYPTVPGRANLVARLTCEQEPVAGPLLLLHHMDVVPADEAAWRHPPFSGVAREGYVYGRGALDMKGFGVMELLALDLLRRSGEPLRRDVILMAVSDEEMAGAYGAGWMVTHEWERIRPAVVWDEGGFGITGDFGPCPIFYVAVAEKQVLWPRVVARGEPGLASIPSNQSAIDRLMAALERLRSQRYPPRLTEVSAAMFKRLAEVVDFPRSLALRHVDHPLVWPLISPSLCDQPQIEAMVRNLVTVTRLRAGQKENVVPGEAEAGLDVRLLPGEDARTFVERLRRMVDDEHVTIELDEYEPPSLVSPHDGGFFATLEGVIRRHVPEALVVPMLTPGGTDSRFFRRRGVAAYGLIPVLVDQAEVSGMHGVDERISVENLRLGTHIVYDVLRRACALDGGAA